MVVGGLLVGNGLLVLIRHRASLGGLGVLAVYLQETRGWRAGTVQMLMDLVILGAAALIIGLHAAALSVLASARKLCPITDKINTIRDTIGILNRSDKKRVNFNDLLASLSAMLL